MYIYTLKQQDVCMFLCKDYETGEAIGLILWGKLSFGPG